MLCCVLCVLCVLCQDRRRRLALSAAAAICSATKIITLLIVI